MDVTGTRLSTMFCDRGLIICLYKVYRESETLSSKKGVTWSFPLMRFLTGACLGQTFAFGALINDRVLLYILLRLMLYYEAGIIEHLVFLLSC